MSKARLWSLAGTAILVVAAVGGCMKFTPSSPQALFTATPVEHLIPFTASFDGSLSEYTAGEIVSYMWNFGDGGAATGVLTDHTYDEDGVYTVTLTVIGSDGSTSSTRLDVRALNPLPTASFSYSPKSNMEGEYIVGANEWLYFDGSESCDDGNVVAYDWNFGDGEYATGPQAEHRYLYPGTYNVVLTVTDNDGGQSSFVERIQVLGGPPCNADVPNGGTCP
ncbi:MAG: PKD domain-containing protein [Candidatus Bipolaricaulota bacterium]